MNHIKIARAFRGMTAADVQAATGISRQRISDYETDYLKPTREMAAKIAEALDVDVAWIMGHPQALSMIDPLDRERHYVAPIMRTEEIDGYGTLCHVYLDTDGVTGIVATIIGDGLQITPRWLDSEQPQDASEIADHCWMDPWGRDCVMLDGLPRVV